MRRTALLLPLIAVAALTGCFSAPPAEPVDIVDAEVSQQQALPDFDTATYLVDDAAELDRLEAMLADEGVDGDYTSSGEACPGGITTHIAYATAHGSHTIEIATCEPSEFDAAVTDLVSEWRTSGEFWPIH